MCSPDCVGWMMIGICKILMAKIKINLLVKELNGQLTAVTKLQQPVAQHTPFKTVIHILEMSSSFH